MLLVAGGAPAAVLGAGLSASTTGAGCGSSLASSNTPAAAIASAASRRPPTFGVCARGGAAGDACREISCAESELTNAQAVARRSWSNDMSLQAPTGRNSPRTTGYGNSGAPVEGAAAGATVVAPVGPGPNS